MKTLLIPVDFSGTSDNALRYAADFSLNNAVEKIILLKTYYVSIYEQILPSVDFVQLSSAEIELEKQSQEVRLNSYKEQLLINCKSEVQVRFSEEPMLRAIYSAVNTHTPDLLIVGSVGIQEETYIGEHLIQIAKSVAVPVLVIPSRIKYRKIDLALIACDFRTLQGIGLLKHLRGISTWLKANIMVLNVDPDKRNLSKQQEYESELKNLLDGYRYEVFYVHDRDIVRGILRFADVHPVDLIVALPKRHSFFYKLTNSSITEAIALNAHTPVLILK